MVIDRRIWPCILAVLALFPLTASAAVSVEQLRTEYLVDPVATDAPHPRLSWVLSESDATVRGQGQTAYAVRAATDATHLEQPDLWDTGKVASTEQNQLPYAGKPVGDGQRCVWQVRVWDRTTARPRGAAGLLGTRVVDQRLVGQLDHRPGRHADRRRAAGRLLSQVVHRGGQGEPRRRLRHRRRRVRAVGQRPQALVATTSRPAGPSTASGCTTRRTTSPTKCSTPAARTRSASRVGDGWFGLQHGGRGRVGGPRAAGDLTLPRRVGRKRVGTDPTWRASADGPIRHRTTSTTARRTTPAGTCPGGTRPASTTPPGGHGDAAVHARPPVGSPRTWSMPSAKRSTPAPTRPAPTGSR